jgi:hypothetical protein
MSIVNLARDAASTVTDNKSTPAGGAGGLSALTRYIPTESVTLYVAGVSATDLVKDTLGTWFPQALYWGMLAVTPLLVLLVFLAELRGASKPLGEWGQWPWWKMVAATIAFGVWALAVKGNPIVSQSGASVIAGFGALLVSTLLSVVGAVVEPPK